MRTPVCRACLTLCVLVFVSIVGPRDARAASYLPLSDGDLAARAPSIVRAQVLSQETRARATPSGDLVFTITTLRVLEVLKGPAPAPAFQIELPGGEVAGARTWFPGTPAFGAGDEVLLFLAPRADASSYGLTDLGLSKFDIVADSAGRRFAVRSTFTPEEDDWLSGRSGRMRPQAAPAARSLRDAESFLAALRALSFSRDFPPVDYASPDGPLRGGLPRIRPLWVNIGGEENGSALFRWFWENGGSPRSVVSVQGSQSNLSDGSDGNSLVEAAVAAWRGVPLSDVRTAFSTGAGNVVVHLDVDNDGSAWSTPLACGQGGVVGYGGPGSSHSAPDFKGEGPYYAIPSGTIWMRHITGSAGCYPAGTFGSAVLHEMGHTLGLGHPDQDASTHSTPCPFDSCTAVMRSTLTGALDPQPDDTAGIQWYYGTAAKDSAPEAVFLSPSSALVDASIQFTDASTGAPTSWSWTFGDATNSVERNPVHAYAATGVYTVRLTASNATGSGSMTRNLTVTTCASSHEAPCRVRVQASPICCRVPRTVSAR